MLPIIFLLISINILSRTSNFCLHSPLFFMASLIEQRRNTGTGQSFRPEKIILYTSLYTDSGMQRFSVVYFGSVSHLQSAETVQWLAPFPLSHSFYFRCNRYIFVDQIIRQQKSWYSHLYLFHGSKSRLQCKYTIPKIRTNITRKGIARP